MTSLRLDRVRAALLALTVVAASLAAGASHAGDLKVTVTNPQGQRGAYLRAYDKASGKDAGAVFMPAGQTGAPMTYMMNGKQYIVVAVGGPGFPAELLAYKLPD